MLLWKEGYSTSRSGYIYHPNFKWFYLDFRLQILTYLFLPIVDVRRGELVSVPERWYRYDVEQKAIVMKYISSLRWKTFIYLSCFPRVLQFYFCWWFWHSYIREVIFVKANCVIRAYFYGEWQTTNLNRYQNSDSQCFLKC